MLGEAIADAKLQAAVRNRLNKVSEGNLSSIATELTQLYSSYPRSLVDRQLAEIVMELSGEGVGRIIGQFAALYAALAGSARENRRWRTGGARKMEWQRPLPAILI